MKKIRGAVFETNSSSMHSICVSGSDNFINTHRQLRGYFDEYGWGYDTLPTPDSKLSYVLTMIQYKDPSVADNFGAFLNSKYYQWLNEMVRDYTGTDIEIESIDDKWYPMGYIDHQSTDVLDDHWSDDEAIFKNNMRDLIFNSKYYIIIDNDNH